MYAKEETKNRSAITINDKDV